MDRECPPEFAPFALFTGFIVLFFFAFVMEVFSEKLAQWHSENEVEGLCFLKRAIPHTREEIVGLQNERLVNRDFYRRNRGRDSWITLESPGLVAWELRLRGEYERNLEQYNKLVAKNNGLLAGSPFHEQLFLKNDLPPLF